MIETRLTFDVSTPQLALQARRKISALIIGGWDVVAMDEYDVQDSQTGQCIRLREVIVVGVSAPTAEFKYKQG